MGIEAFGRAIKRTVDGAVAERDRRFNDPGFQRELREERRKTGESFRTMGENTLDTAYSALLKAPLTPVWRTLQMIAGAKHNGRKVEFKDIILDTLAEFGKVGWKATKLTASALVAAGRTAKLGIRHTLAI